MATSRLSRVRTVLTESITTCECVVARFGVFFVGTIKSFVLFAQPQTAWADAWNTIVPLLQSGVIKPIVAKTFPLAEAADALRYLVEGRPFGRFVLTL